MLGDFFNNAFLIVKIISVIVSIGFVGGIIYGLFRLWGIDESASKKAKEHFYIPPQEKNKNLKRWEEIATLFSSQDSNNWRIAIIDADTMLEDCMRELGYEGKTMGDMMKSMQGVSWIQSAWDVHLLRNKIAHEGSRYSLNEREVYRAFRIYQDVLFNTGYLKYEKS